MEYSVLERQGWLKAGALRTVIQKALIRGHAPQQLWYLIVWEAWSRKQLSSVAAA
jgi:hypothetical protein